MTPTYAPHGEEEEDEPEYECPACMMSDGDHLSDCPVAERESHSDGDLGATEKGRGR